MTHDSAESFEFVAVRFDPRARRADFRYRMHFRHQRPLDFTETVLLPRIPRQDLPRPLVAQALRTVHLALGVSYYKLYAPRRVAVRGRLSRPEAELWTTVYRDGLGEFFYRNHLDPHQSPKFPAAARSAPAPPELTRRPRTTLGTGQSGTQRGAQRSRVLVGVGGGKDSIVAVELLKAQGHDVTAFVVETQRSSPLISRIVDTMRIPQLTMRRVLDEKLFTDLPGQYRGHIPISAITAALGVLAAVLYDYASVIVANEYSSSFGNLRYRGLTINHQWSKSAEFERLFQTVVQGTLTPDITYFSVLRPFTELRIAKVLTRFPMYLSLFSSCNANFAIARRGGPRWCGACPKCAFVFALLAAFLSKRKLLGVFGRNFYDDARLLPLYRDLLGFGTMKPLDCVGTPQEMRAALILSAKRFPSSRIVRVFAKRIRNPQTVVSEAFRTHPAPTIPTAFRFIGMERVLLLGYGREGRVTRSYLRKRYPGVRVGIADEKQGKGYLSRQREYDIAVRTPGIPARQVVIPYTTATNLFFARVPRAHTIGVTGTKGKSTTASLIHAMLTAAGKRSQLIGNIGSPMLEALMRPMHAQELFVLELSSYQLDDVEFSPHVAVVLRLFPDHMDYHGTVEAYYAAKRNILAFQRSEDVFIYHPKDARLARWAAAATARAIPCTADLPVPTSDLPLLGEHNQENIRAAVTVARLLHLPESAIQKAIKTFKPLPHRLEFIGEFRGIRFYDDAIATTPEATIAALRALPDVGTLLLGGKDRGYDFTELRKVIEDRNIPNIVLFPESGKRIFTSTRGLNVLRTKSTRAAVAFAYQHTPAGSVCLLSPASPSYSLWRNFEERGDAFQTFVKKLR